MSETISPQDAFIAARIKRECLAVVGSRSAEERELECSVVVDSIPAEERVGSYFEEQALKIHGFIAESAMTQSLGGNPLKSIQSRLSRFFGFDDQVKASQPISLSSKKEVKKYVLSTGGNVDGFIDESAGHLSNLIAAQNPKEVVLNPQIASTVANDKTRNKIDYVTASVLDQEEVKYFLNSLPNDIRGMIVDQAREMTFEKIIKSEEEARLRALRDSQPEDGYVELKEKTDTIPGTTVTGRNRFFNEFKFKMTKIDALSTAAGFIAGGVTKSVVHTGLTSLVGGIGASIALGAGINGIRVHYKETNNYWKEKRAEKGVDRLGLQDTVNGFFTLRDTDRNKKIGKAIARGAVFGAIGGVGGSAVAEIAGWTQNLVDTSHAQVSGVLGISDTVEVTNTVTNISIEPEIVNNTFETSLDLADVAAVTDVVDITNVIDSPIVEQLVQPEEIVPEYAIDTNLDVSDVSEIVNIAQEAGIVEVTDVVAVADVAAVAKDVDVSNVLAVPVFEPSVLPEVVVDSPEFAASTSEDIIYTVKKGDSLWDIAKEHLGADRSVTEIVDYVKKIAELNELEDPNRIHASNKLLLPA